MGLSCTLEDKKDVTSGEGARQSVSDGSNGMCKGPVSGVRNWVKAWLRCRETGQRGTWQDGAVDVTKILRVLRTMVRILVFIPRVLRSQVRISAENREGEDGRVISANETLVLCAL